MTSTKTPSTPSSRSPPRKDERLLLEDPARHNIPRRLKPFLIAHEVKTAREMGWEALANGRLLTAAKEAGFDLLLTTDKNMGYQQNLSDRKIAVRVLSQQQWPRLRLRMDIVIAALEHVVAGSFAAIDIPAS